MNGPVVDVWLVRFADWADRHHDCLAILSPQERARADRLKAAGPRGRFVLTRAVLRLLLADRLGRTPRDVPIVYGGRGKPALDGVPTAFNVSHCGPGAVIALSKDVIDLGVDLECSRNVTNPRHVAELLLAAEACGAVAETATAPAELARLWAAKEAFLKATGQGWNFDPRRVRPVPTAGGGLMFVENLESDLAGPRAGEWRGLELPADRLLPLGTDFFAAVVWRTIVPQTMIDVRLHAELRPDSFRAIEAGDSRAPLC